MQRVSSKEAIFRRLNRHNADLKLLGVKRLGVFGSFAKGRPNVKSDVDILVEFETGQKTFDNFIRLGEMLENLFQRRVELVTTEALSPYLGPRILQQVEYAALSA